MPPDHRPNDASLSVPPIAVGIANYEILLEPCHTHQMVLIGSEIEGGLDEGWRGGAKVRQAGPSVACRECGGGGQRFVKRGQESPVGSVGWMVAFSDRSWPPFGIVLPATPPLTHIDLLPSFYTTVAELEWQTGVVLQAYPFPLYSTSSHPKTNATPTTKSCRIKPECHWH